MNQQKAICHFPFEYVEIFGDGNVYPCCPAYNNYTSFGNVFEEKDFGKIWNSPVAQEFRKAIIDGDYCKFCNFNICSFDKNYLTDFDEDKYSTYLNKYPKSVKFCHDSSCNARCVTCRDKKHVISPKDTEKLNALIEPIFLPMLKDAEVVGLNGAGDPFASKHCRLLIKEIAKKYPNLKFHIHSNGLAFNKANCDELGIANRIRSAEISIHATTKKTYDKIVRDSNFDKVMENLYYLVSLKNEGKIEYVQIDFVISVINYKEMFSFQSHANQLGVNTSFATYRPWNSEMANHYDEVAVFKDSHPQHSEFVKILKNPIFDSQNCCLENSLKALR